MNKQLACYLRKLNLKNAVKPTQPQAKKLIMKNSQKIKLKEVEDKASKLKHDSAGRRLNNEDIKNNFKIAKENWLKQLDGLTMLEYEDKLEKDAIEKIEQLTLISLDKNKPKGLRND